MEKKTNKKTAKAANEKKTEVAGAKSESISTRGRIFQGKVIRKFPKRITIISERTVKIPKFERFMKKTTKIHARLPDEMAHDINIGDIVLVQECRPLSKTIHHLVVEKVRSTENGENK